MKKTLSFFQYEILKKELHYLEEVGGLELNQANELMNYYEVSDKPTKSKNVSNSLWNIEHRITERPQKREGISLNFIQIISIIGAVLIGLGVLSFVASNWSHLSNVQKFFLLLGGLIASYVSAWMTEDKRPITSKALYYIGAFIYGAEIFYIGQMFHLGGELHNALFAWSIGIIPLAFYRKDRILYAVGFGLLYLAIEMKFMFTYNAEPSLWMMLIIPLLFVANQHLKFLNPYLKIANLALFYQFVEMKFFFNEDIRTLWLIPILLLLFAIGELLFKGKAYIRIANFVLLYQFLQLNIIIHSFENFLYMFILLLMVPVLFVVGHRFMNKSIPLFIVNVIMAIELVLLFLIHSEVETASWYLIIVFVVGIAFTHKQLPNYDSVMKWMGVFFQFVTGFSLTIPFVYGDGLTLLWAVFGLFYLVYGLYLAYKNELFGVVIVSVLIFRFYVDLSLVFMNKSIAFLVGGVLLLGLAYWFEKTRRGEKKHEK